MYLEPQNVSNSGEVPPIKLPLISIPSMKTRRDAQVSEYAQVFGNPLMEE